MEKNKLKPGIYVVATPIGNLQDITLRALETLKNADIIACEDTRTTNKLLQHYGIVGKKLLTYNDFGEEKSKDYVISLVKSGNSIALVSDAGTPLISDPGYKLISLARSEDIFITSIPGASSIISALVISGMPTDNFNFIGFLPTKISEKKRLLANITSDIIILFESPKRLLVSLNLFQEIFGDNLEIAVAREMTKLFEEVVKDKIAKVIEHFTTNLPRGEIVMILNRKNINKDISIEELVEDIKQKLAHHNAKDVLQEMMIKTQKSKKEIYELILKIQGKK